MATVMNDNPGGSDADVRAQVSDEEWAVRVDLAAAYRLVALYGWDDLIFTHLSARVPGPEHHFLINPYDMMFEEITASSLVKIDVDGQPVIPSPHPVNPAGFTIHSALHMNCEEAHSVMHLHTPHGQAVSAMAARPSSPKTIEGTAARLLIETSTQSIHQVRGANSSR